MVPGPVDSQVGWSNQSVCATVWLMKQNSPVSVSCP